MDRRKFVFTGIPAATAVVLPGYGGGDSDNSIATPPVDTSENIEVIYRQALSPEDPTLGWAGFKPGTSILPAGSTYPPGELPLPSDIQLDRDVAVLLRDGTKIYVDVYRPIGSGPVPAVIAWSPYGKQGGYQRYDRLGWVGINPTQVSGLHKSLWEGPDPGFWCANGYAVVNVDPRGAFESQGNVQWFSPKEGRDGHDVVEWIAAQGWCNQAVVMAGNSWLGASQWLIASTRPPHLAAIAPWEGFSDIYRDLTLHGGIPDHSLTEIITQKNAGRQFVEDLPAMTDKYQYMNSYWRSKIFDIEAINVPVYAVASWDNVAHTRGTLDAFSRLAPANSWLRVHNTQEWPDQFEYQEDLLKYFDYFTKGKKNGWNKTPRVRLSVLDPSGSDVVNRPEAAYPLARVQERTLYLEASNRSISTNAPSNEAVTEYTKSSGNAIFEFTAAHDVEIVGPIGLKLWLETEAQDADVFVYLRKADANGQPLLHNTPAGPFIGAHGRLRATHRELDETRSTARAPVHKHEKAMPVISGTPMAIEIGIWPVGMAWHAGEKMQLIISYAPISLLTTEEVPGINSGALKIHTGGKYDSRIVLPVTTTQGL